MPAAVTAEGDEMRLSGLMEALKSPRHAKSLAGSNCPTQAKKRLEWATQRACYDGRMFNFGKPKTVGDWMVHVFGAIVAIFLVWWMLRVYVL
jgi:hypothetical protein